MIRSLTSYTKAYLSHKLRKIKLSYLPVQISIEPTNVCNFKCKFCNQSSPEHHNKRSAGKINLSDYELILGKIKKECAVRIISLTLDGEPSLHKDLKKLIGLANRIGLFVRFSSNGFKTGQEFLEETKDLSYLISIDFSLDKDGFEKYRGNKNSWSVVHDNLRTILDYMDINPNLHLEIFENSAYYDDTAKVGANLESMMKHFGKAPRLTYGIRTYHKVLDGQPLVEGRKYYGCLYPWTSLNIAWNGDVVTCCRDLDGQYILGNVIKSSIEEVWNGQKYLNLRKALLAQDLGSIPSCRFCDLPYDTHRYKLSYIIKKVLRKW